MKLHRAAKKSDWERIPAADWNSWQRLAADTHKVVTPGNIVSLVGLLATIAGLLLVGRQRLWAGLVGIGIGRLLDIVDGLVADHTGTKSHIGEGVDAGFDKLAALLALIILTASHILPWPLAVLIGAQNAVTALFSLGADIAGRTIHPNIAGKLGTALLWAALGGILLGAALHNHPIKIAAETLAVLAVALSGGATVHYMYGTLRAQKR